MQRLAIPLDEMPATEYTSTARGEGVRAAIARHGSVLDGRKTGCDDALLDVATAFDAHKTAYRDEVNPDFHVYSVWGDLHKVFGLKVDVALRVEARLNQLRWNTKRELPKDVRELYDRMTPH
mgnify:CR=1 FL=1